VAAQRTQATGEACAELSGRTYEGLTLSSKVILPICTDAVGPLLMRGREHNGIDVIGLQRL
jgi:hypothetical protein